MEGKIIAVIGAPASGKSFLARKLGGYFNCQVFFEGEIENLPQRILENFSKQVRNFETTIWFRNQRVKDFLDALKLKEKGENVVLDTFWITNQLHIDTMLEGFEKERALELAELDKDLLPWPDLIIFLRTDEEVIRKFIKLRGRHFDQSESFIKRILNINKEHEKFIENSNLDNLLIINRDDFDFEKEDDFNRLLDKIKEKLAI